MSKSTNNPTPEGPTLHAPLKTLGGDAPAASVDDLVLDVVSGVRERLVAEAAEVADAVVEEVTDRLLEEVPWRLLEEVQDQFD